MSSERIKSCRKGVRGMWGLGRMKMPWDDTWRSSPVKIAGIDYGAWAGSSRSFTNLIRSMAVVGRFCARRDGRLASICP